MKHFIFLVNFILSITLFAQARNPWNDYKNPTETHNLFKKYTGDFSMEIIMYLEHEDSIVYNVDSKHAMLLGGRFLEMNQRGSIQDMEYLTRMTIGYNNASQQITMTVLTNMGTGTLNLVGHWTEKGKKAELHGHLLNPVTKNWIQVRQEITFVDENTLIIENFDRTETAPESKTVRYTLTRK